VKSELSWKVPASPRLSWRVSPSTTLEPKYAFYFSNTKLKAVISTLYLKSQVTALINVVLLYFSLFNVSRTNGKEKARIQHRESFMQVFEMSGGS